MRSAPPQPGNYLGDDPDLTADLGQRLAATAQTGQGLITNYLFYGQRRASEQQLTDRQGRDAERWQEQSADSARAGDRHPVADAAHRTRDHLNRAPHPQGAPIESTVTDGQAETARRTFRIVAPPDAEPRTGSAHHDPADPGDQQQPIEDHLRVDALADDPNHRDPLADPSAAVVPERVTLNAQGPVRGH